MIDDRNEKKCVATMDTTSEKKGEREEREKGEKREK